MLLLETLIIGGVGLTTAVIILWIATRPEGGKKRTRRYDGGNSGGGDSLSNFIYSGPFEISEANSPAEAGIDFGGGEFGGGGSGGSYDVASDSGGDAGDSGGGGGDD